MTDCKTEGLVALIPTLKELDCCNRCIIKFLNDPAANSLILVDSCLEPAESLVSIIIILLLFIITLFIYYRNSWKVMINERLRK